MWLGGKTGREGLYSCQSEIEVRERNGPEKEEWNIVERE